MKAPFQPFRQINDSFSNQIRDEWLRDQTAYALFCADLGNCKCVRVDVYDVSEHADVFLFILARIPLLISYTAYGGAAVVSSLYEGYRARHAFNESDTLIMLRNAKSATVTSKDFVSEWIRTSYTSEKHPVRCGSYWYLDLTDTTMGQTEIWKTYKHLLYELYVNSEVPIYDIPYGDGFDPEPNVHGDIQTYESIQDEINAGYVPPSDESDESLSEQKWDLLRGYYTAYIDNLGVFLKHGLTMDQMTYLDLMDKHGYVMDDYCVCKRLLNAGEQQNVDTFQQWLGWIPGIGQMDDVYTDVVTKYRYLVPRVAAFDRQERVIPDYNQYRNFCISIGAIAQGTVTFHSKPKVYLTQENWRDFLKPIFKTRSCALKWAPKSILDEILAEEKNIGDGDDSWNPKSYQRRRR